MVAKFPEVTAVRDATDHSTGERALHSQGLNVRSHAFHGGV